MEIKEKIEKIKKDPKIWITLYVVISAVLLYVYPPMQVSHFEINNSTTIATLENQYRTTLAQILGGGAVAIGIYFAWGNLKVAQSTLESNQKNAEKNLEVALANLKSDQETAQKNIEIALATLDSNIKNAQKSLEIIQEGQNTERFTRAVDQLGAVDKDGNPVIEIRLGAIYALEKIADKSEESFWPIIEILTAYVRKNSPAEMADSQNKASLDIHAILTVIGRRNSVYRQEESKSLDLRRTNLKGLELIDAHFEKAHLTGTNLEGASITGTHLEGAFLSGTNLEGAFITGTRLEGTFLNGAHFKWTKFYFTSLNGADLRAADLRGAYFYSLDELSKVKTLYKAELDEGLEKELRAKGFAHLLDDEP